MCGIATFTMLVSSSSSTDASDTVIAIRYLKRYRSGAAGSAIAVMLVRLDGRYDAHPRPERMHQVAQLHRLLGDDAGRWRDDPRVGQLECRLIAGSTRRRDAGIGTDKHGLRGGKL